jgi:cyclophilin family peptidyl-prolyl cis-trans isomerase
LFGHTVPSELRSKWAMSYRRPIGVAGLITPFNFPLAIPTWKMFPALVCGNSVVIKPSEDVPHTAHLLVEILLEAGLPPEVIQLVHGGGDTGRALVEHPDVPVISFTGSTATGSAIGEACGRSHKRLSLEMGGKNAMIVMDDADLDLALDGVLWGAFGTTGQRCTATSRLILQSGVHDEFLSRLIDRARAMKLGEGNGVVQGGIRDATKLYPPIAHEPTSKTGITHGDGTISMARADPGSARADYFITVGPVPGFDAGPQSGGDQLGYAAFGHVIEGMEVVRQLLVAPSSPILGEGAMKGQMLDPAIKVTSARRVK